LIVVGPSDCILLSVIFGQLYDIKNEYKNNSYMKMVLKEKRITAQNAKPDFLVLLSGGEVHLKALWCCGQ